MNEHEMNLAQGRGAAMIPASFAEKAMASLMQLHSELAAEKERRVQLYRALMQKEQSLAELAMYVRVLEERLGVAAPEQPLGAHKPISQVRSAEPVREASPERSARSPEAEVAPTPIPAQRAASEPAVTHSPVSDSSPARAPVASPPRTSAGQAVRPAAAPSPRASAGPAPVASAPAVCPAPAAAANASRPAQEGWKVW
jgi:hypothetical protein